MPLRYKTRKQEEKAALVSELASHASTTTDFWATSGVRCPHARGLETNPGTGTKRCPHLTFMNWMTIKLLYKCPRINKYIKYYRKWTHAAGVQRWDVTGVPPVVTSPATVMMCWRDNSRGGWRGVSGVPRCPERGGGMCIPHIFWAVGRFRAVETWSLTGRPSEPRRSAARWMQKCNSAPTQWANPHIQRGGGFALNRLVAVDPIYEMRNVKKMYFCMSAVASLLFFSFFHIYFVNLRASYLIILWIEHCSF